MFLLHIYVRTYVKYTSVKYCHLWKQNSRGKEMDKPVIVDKLPVEIQVEASKTYYWCSCGKSQNQPFCDGAHTGSSFEPVAFTAEKDGPMYLCQCKHTKNPPYCDGSHNELTD